MTRTPGLTLLAVLLGACKDQPPPPVPPLPPAPVASALPPAAIEAALPDVAPPPLERRAECAKEGCVLAHMVPDEVRPALSDGAPGVLWEHALAERASLVFPRDEVVEVLGVVLDGSVDLTPMEAAPKATPVGGRWSAFRAPGGGLTINGVGGRAARVALVVVTAGPRAALGAHLDQRDRPAPPPSWSWKSRPGRVETWSFAGRGDLAWGGGAYHARLGLDGAEKPVAALDVLRMAPDAPVAEHVHEQEWEILAMLQGEGTVVRRPAAGEQRISARPGAIYAIPPAERHAFQPSGKAPFLAIQVYAPPGPEQRYKKLSAPPP